MDCPCGVPSQANYYTCLVISAPDRDTTYADWYSCADHVEDFSEGDTYAYDGCPYTIEEVTQTELR